MFIIIIYSYNKLDRARCLQINITRVRLWTEKRRLEFFVVLISESRSIHARIRVAVNSRRDKTYFGKLITVR